MDFEWDAVKAQSNLAKHRVSFESSVRVFLDPNVVDFDVSKPGDDEDRHKAVGRIEGRLFTLVYTLRGNVIRVISARRSNGSEVRRYDQI